tara:strand:- start:846 stop:1286 length:441 start_codon:yes stop_codon:yes gene_type:complete
MEAYREFVAFVEERAGDFTGAYKEYNRLLDKIDEYETRTKELEKYRKFISRIIMDILVSPSDDWRDYGVDKSDYLSKYPGLDSYIDHISGKLRDFLALKYECFCEVEDYLKDLIPCLATLHPCSYADYSDKLKVFTELESTCPGCV